MSTIIKVKNRTIQDFSGMARVSGLVNAQDIIKLLDSNIDLTPNPRKSRKNLVVNDIIETLEREPDLMALKSKGVVIATTSCQILERERVKLTFDNADFEGILDGGHTILALGIYLLRKLGEEEKQIRRVKNWDDFAELWQSCFNDMDEDDRKEIIQEFDFFEVSIEIIYLTTMLDHDFQDKVISISDARNNNTPHKDTAIDNFRNYYQILKNNLDPEINEKVQWKDNDSEKPISPRDIIAASMICLLGLPKEYHKGISINPVSIYSGKGKCVDNFSKLYDEVHKKGTWEEPYISAFGLIKDLPSLFDQLYLQFPDAYKETSQAFGRMGGVKPWKKGSKTYFYRKEYEKHECKYEWKNYLGFIYPVYVSLHKLMKYDDKTHQLTWATNPFDFIKHHLVDLASTHYANIRENNYNPNKVGKSSSAYISISDRIELIAIKNHWR